MVKEFFHDQRGQKMGARDKTRDKAEVKKGRLKEAARKASGDRTLEAEGEGDQTSGNLKQAGEKLEDAVRGVR